MSDLIPKPPMDDFEARQLTEEVKADAQALWAKLLELYEGQAHLVLGYSSWGEYYEAEFGQSGRTGYRLLEAARVVDTLPSDTRVTQNVARELAKADDPAEAWADVVELNGHRPTATQARAVVQERRELKDPATDKQMAYLRSLGHHHQTSRSRNRPRRNGSRNYSATAIARARCAARATTERKAGSYELPELPSAIRRRAVPDVRCRTRLHRASAVPR